MNEFRKAQAARNAAKERKERGLKANKNLKNYKQYQKRVQTAASTRWYRKKVPPPQPTPKPRRRNNTSPPKTPLQPINSKYQNALKYFGYPNLTATTAAKLQSNYRKMALHVHPNRRGGSDESFKILKGHFDVLSAKRVF
jgi:hypothetical protein